MTPLPSRPDRVVGALPEAFRPSQVDYLPDSMCWYDGTWLISTNAWEDRRLARRDPAGTWTEVPAPRGWIRRPMAAGGELAILHHERHADRGRVLALRRGRWETVAEPVEHAAVTDWNGRAITSRDAAGNATAWAASGRIVGVGAGSPRHVEGPGWRIPIPDGATLTHLSPSPDRSAVFVTLRVGGSHQSHVFSMRDGRPISRGSLRQALIPASAWTGESRIVVVAEEWPSLVPLVWDWARGTLTPVWPDKALGAARSVAAGPDGTCVLAVADPAASRSMRLLDDAPPAQDACDDVRAVVVERDGQRLPCLVHEPPVAPKGTVFCFPGGPHEPVWAEYAPLAVAMNQLGWRVVRANVRSSGLREPAYRPARPIRYGHDDVADACAVIDTLAEGPVVTLGMSYGGYLATLAGELSPRCLGVVVLAGFLDHTDLTGTAHAGVREFSSFAFADRPPARPSRLTRRYFIAHGELDTRIPIPAVERHRTRMDHAPVFLRLAGEGHGIHTDRAARATYPPLLRWLSDLA